jgi:hypothetical protein
VRIGRFSHMENGPDLNIPELRIGMVSEWSQNSLTTIHPSNMGVYQDESALRAALPPSFATRQRTKRIRATLAISVAPSQFCAAPYSMPA